METPSGNWPLSAAATQVLRDPSAEGRDLLKLTLKELVLRRVWALEDRETKGLLHGRRTLKAFVPGDRTVPEMGPLPRVDEALRREVPPEGKDVRKTVVQIIGGGKLVTRVREDARREAEGLGLVTIERRKVLGMFPRTVVTVTSAGEGWREDSERREEALAEGLRRRPRTALDELAAMGGLVLLVSPPVLEELDEAVLRLQGVAATGDASGATSGDDGDLLPELDLGALGIGDEAGWGGLDLTFDSALDAGASGGGDGGGGGGGDGGGGGS